MIIMLDAGTYHRHPILSARIPPSGAPVAEPVAKTMFKMPSSTRSAHELEVATGTYTLPCTSGAQWYNVGEDD